MSIRDTLFRVAPEFYTVDAAVLADIDLFIVDAQTDVTLSTSHAKYSRAVAYYAAGLICDSKGAGIGFGIKREKTSLGEIEYQTAKSGKHSNGYFDMYYAILGAAAKQTGFVANRR